ncbi:hypothetical protein [Cesiribacter andamanensis]|nr:hypothetical protein [Cesiribacter andamanensis]
MKSYLLVLFVLPFLLFALPTEAGLPTSGPGRGINSSLPGSSLFFGAAHAGAVPTGAVHTGAVHTGAVPQGAALKDAMPTAATQLEGSSSCQKSSKGAKKPCTKRKCLKHHHQDPAPAGSVPASVCSQLLVAVVHQPEALCLIPPVRATRSGSFYRAHLTAPALELEPRPPRFS